MKKIFQLGPKFHGKGPVIFSWQPTGTYLATAGVNGIVHICDRQGVKIDEVGLTMTTPVTALEWDCEGETLAILQKGNGMIPLWDVTSRTIFNLDTNLKDPTFIKWSNVGSHLAIGTLRGNLVLYNKQTRKKIPILGKHSRKITCGCWNADNILALGSEDRMFTVSNAQGDTLEQKELKHTPSGMQFGFQKGNDIGSSRARKNQPENVIAINIGKYFVLFKLSDPSTPLELSFQEHYGSIVKSEWFSDGLLIIVFSDGFLVVVSTHPNEIGEEVFSGRFFSQRLYTMAYSPVLNRVTISGDSGMKVIDMSTYTEIKADAVGLVDAEDNEATAMSYSPDGQILTVATLGGIIQTFLTKMISLYDRYGTYIAYLSSLREVTVVNTRNAQINSSMKEFADQEQRQIQTKDLIKINIIVEPSFVALGPRHVAVGMNNRVWYYLCDGSEKEKLINEQQYLGSVQTVKLNADYAAVLFDGKVILHRIESSVNVTERTKVFPDDIEINGGDSYNSSRNDGGSYENFKNNESKIVKKQILAIEMTKDFLIFGTKAGTIHFFYLKDWVMLNGSEYRHEEAIVQMQSNKLGTKIVFIDARRKVFFFSSVNAEILPIPDTANINNILWDTMDSRVFCLVNSTSFQIYLYISLSTGGPQVSQLGSMEIHESGDWMIIPETTKITNGYTPVLLSDGQLICQQQNGTLSKVCSVTHDRLELTNSRNSLEAEKASFRQNLMLLRLGIAWKEAQSIDLRSYYLALAARAMETHDSQTAILVYRHIRDSGMVMSLERIHQMDERNVHAGHLFMLMDEHFKAQELFLLSSDPLMALHMQKDIFHWDEALQLANKLKPSMLQEISLSYAKQLEFKGEIETALKMYQQAATSIREANEKMDQPEDPLKIAGYAGVARMTMRLGDVRRGMKIILEMDDKKVYTEGAQILESMKQYNDAALLYEKGEQYDKAVGIYIQIKNMTKAASLIKHISTPKILIQYAKAKETNGEYSEASNYYELANDMDNVVRLQLEYINNTDKAFNIVRNTKSSDASLSIVKYCRQSGNYRGAIEFLIMANHIEEAFQLTSSQNEMDYFTSMLGDRINAEQATKVAAYYEHLKVWGKAGDYFQICGSYSKALKLYLLCGESEINKAIEVVGKARNDALTHELIDFLMGDRDGEPKDPKYVFRLYMALGDYQQAAKTGMIIARQEQELGNYGVAHGILFETHYELQLQKIRISQELGTMLMILHSYILVKKLIKQGDHESSARMLIRVSKNISKFPLHIVNILTTTVIECKRANLNAQCYEYARVLMQPDHRSNVDIKYKKKIEAIVRRPNKEELPEALSSCPFCDYKLPLTELDCTGCKSWIPFCIITGRHMVRNDWCSCPKCNFPALFSSFLAFLDIEPTCPMCKKEVTKSELHKFSENEVDNLLKGNVDDGESVKNSLDLDRAKTNSHKIVEE